MVIGLMCAMIEDPPRFIANHPFIFFIRDVRSGLLLFSGRLAVPKQEI